MLSKILYFICFFIILCLFFIHFKPYLKNELSEVLYIGFIVILVYFSYNSLIINNDDKDLTEKFTEVGDITETKVQKNFVGNSGFYNKTTQKITNVDNLIPGSGIGCEIIKLPNPSDSDYVLKQGVIGQSKNSKVSYKLSFNLKPAKYLFSVWLAHDCIWNIENLKLFTLQIEGSKDFIEQPGTIVETKLVKNNIIIDGMAWNKYSYIFDFTKLVNNDLPYYDIFWGLGFQFPDNHKGYRYLSGLSCNLYNCKTDNMPKSENLKMYLNAFDGNGNDIWSDSGLNESYLKWQTAPSWNSKDGYRF